MWHPIEAAVKKIGLEQFVPEQQPKERMQRMFSAKKTRYPLRRITLATPASGLPR
jgi:hypothetical protein